MVRELHVIAVAQDALQEFQDSRFPRCLCDEENCSGREGHHCVKRRPTYRSIVDVVKTIKSNSVAENLFSAISRSAFRLERSPVGQVCKVRDASGIRDFVNNLYNSFKKGLLEPDEPFLRVSKIFKNQHSVRPGAKSSQVPKFKPLHASEDGCVLIHSRSNPKDPNRSQSVVCAYFIEPSHAVNGLPDLSGMIKRAFETRGVHHTTQDNGNSTITDATQPDKSSTPWNIQNTYGVTWYGLEFQEMVTSFTDLAPLDVLGTQGLPEISLGPSLAFACIAGCLSGPWFDKRPSYVRHGPGPHQLQFIIYKIVLRRLRMNGPQEHFVRCCVDCAAKNTSESLPKTCRCGCLSAWASRMIHNQYLPRLQSQSSEGDSVIAACPIFDKPFKDLKELYEQYSQFRSWLVEQESEKQEPGRKRARADN